MSKRSSNSPEVVENKEKKPFYKTKTAFFLAAVAVSLLLSILICLLANDAFALTADEGEVTLVFTEITEVKDAARMLKSEGLIGSKLWFRTYLGIRGRKLTVQPGTYTIRRSAGFDGTYHALST